MRAAARILEGLNPAQREAAEAVRGPVAVLAGAGTGKTTTITHRIALQVATDVFRAEHILAVTFTEKAARELNDRLRALGVDGVEARAVHAAGGALLGRRGARCTGEALPDVLESKAPVIASLANALPPPHRFQPRSDLAGEIEWAKNRMVRPERYVEEVERTGHQPPIPAHLMERVFGGYERRKTSMGRIDFEDMLGLAVLLLEEHPAAADEIRDRYRAFTVDEYQDVNPLQAVLLDRWLAGRDDICVVGDDYQTIYSFTGASPEHLLGFVDRFPHARIVRLEENYRSTPEILATANRLVPRLGGFEKRLRATRPPGPAPVVRPVADESAEVRFVVDAVQRLRMEGTALEEIAVLYRINARSEPYEEAFAAAGIPYQVRDGAFLRRPGPRAVIQRLRRERGSVHEAVERATAALGLRDAPPLASEEWESEEEATRQADLARMRSLSEEFSSAHPDGDIAAFLSELATRFSAEATGRGANLLTYHRAKGLEFDAVFLPRSLDGELPYRSGRSRADVAEERRLFYVGITRARRHLFVTWPHGARSRRSPFVEEILGEERGPDPAGRLPATSDRVHAGSRPPAPAEDRPLFEALRKWRLERARTDGVPPYVVFHDRVLVEIAGRRPRTRLDLLDVPGVGPAKVERYATEVLELVSASG